MTLTLPDDILKQAGLTEQEALVEFACRLFDAGKLPLWPAAQLAGLSRIEFEDECLDRNIPLYRITPEDLERDLKAIDSLGA